MTSAECRRGGRYLAEERGAFDPPAIPEHLFVEREPPARVGFSLFEIAHMDESTRDFVVQLLNEQQVA